MATSTDTGLAPRPTNPPASEASVIAAIDHQIELERSRELEKLRGLGKVKIALNQRKTHRLARALLKKVNFGPLDEHTKHKSRKTSWEKTSRGKRARHRKSAKEESSDGIKGDRVVVGSRDIGSALEDKIMEAQEEELHELRTMKVVQKHLEKRETFARARRMFNRRVVARPTLSRRASFLVTAYEETDESEVADYIRQQSEFVIDNFFSIPPKERRVLDRLTSTQMRWISDAELEKAKARQSGQLEPEKLSEEKRRDSGPTDMHRESEQMEPGMFEVVSNDEKKVKKRHHLLKTGKKRVKENEEKSSAKKDRGWRRSKGEKRRHHRDVVEEGLLEEAAGWSEGTGRRHSSRTKTSHGDSEVHVSEVRRKSWRRQERAGSDALEQYERIRESDVMANRRISVDADIRLSSVGASHEPTGSESSPLRGVQSQHTLHSVRSKQKSSVITPIECSGSAIQVGITPSPVVAPRTTYRATSPKEREEEEGDDVFQDLDSADSPIPTKPTSTSQLSPTPPPAMSHGHLAVGMGAPPPLENGHSTTAITEESHHTRVQMSSALDSVSEDSELEDEPAPVEKYIYEDQEVATSDQVQSSDAAGHKEAEIQALVMGNGQMWEDVIPSSEQELLMFAGEEEECEESSVAPPQIQEPPSDWNLVPGHQSPVSPIVSTTLPHKGTAEDQTDGSFETISPKAKMFYLDGSSHTSSFDSNPSTGSSRYKRFFSSPQLSLTSGENSLQFVSHPYMTGLCRYSNTPHGYYSYEAEVNPFSVEFQEALKENQGQKQERMVGPPNKCGTAAFSSQQTSTSTSRREPSQALNLPPHVFDDPGFRVFSAELDHEPTRSDYISYKIALIGDAIDAKYDTQLNQALDALFTEVLKNTITWDSFSRAAKKLMLQGQYIQDGIFMIPCFGRRLLEFVPQLRNTITGYTQRVMDNSWDLILTSGGWDAMMQGYSHPEVSPDYEDWRKRESQEEGEGLVDAVGAMGYDLFSPDSESRGISFAIASTAAERAMAHHRTPCPRNQPYSLDDTVRHPRVADPHCLFLDPLASERCPSFGGHLRRRVNSVEVLLSQTGGEDDISETDNIRSVPAGISRLESRRHSSPSIRNNDTFLLPRVSSPIPIPSVRTYNPSSQEGPSSMPHVISVGNGGGTPVMEIFSVKQTAVVESRHGFISVGRYTHSRESSIGSTGSCSTIHIITGEETLVDLHLSQPVSSGEELDQHGPSQSKDSVKPDHSNRHGPTPSSAHTTGGNRAAKRTANSDPTSDYMDLGFSTLDFARRGRPARSSTDSVFTHDVGSGEWRTVTGSPRQRRRRRSSLQVVSENIATVGPILTHAAIGVFAVMFAGRQ